MRKRPNRYEPIPFALPLSELKALQASEVARSHAPDLPPGFVPVSLTYRLGSFWMTWPAARGVAPTGRGILTRCVEPRA